MLLMVEKGIRGGTCHTVYEYVKANNKCLKDHDKNKESSFLKYWDEHNLYGWAMSQKVPVGGFKCVENTSQFSRDYIENHNEDSDGGFFIEVDVQYPKKYKFFTMVFPFLPEKWTLKTLKNL